MLQVTDDGVKIGLNSQGKMTSVPLQEILVFAVLNFINAILGFELDLYSREIAILMPAIIGFLILLTRQWRLKNQPKILSGGDLRLSNQQFEHDMFGTTTQYYLQDNDKIEVINDLLLIKNQQGKTLYQINGFSEPKHLQVAQAVLQGKAIKTQGKAIKLQSQN